MIVVGHGDPRSNADRVVGGRAGGARGLGAGATRSSGWWSGLRSCWRRPPAWRAGRSPARSAARAAWSAIGGCVLPATAWPGSATRRARASRGHTARTPISASWPARPAAARGVRPLDRAAGRPRPRRRQRPNVWRFLRAQRIDLAGRKSWRLSTDPEFAVKAADIIGLYLAPPEHAIVLAVDEKPAIQALERAQGYLKLPNGRALTGFAHDYKRRGTTTLFTALESPPARSKPSTPSAGGVPSSSTS